MIATESDGLMRHGFHHSHVRRQQGYRFRAFVPLIRAQTSITTAHHNHGNIRWDSRSWVTFTPWSDPPQMHAMASSNRTIRSIGLDPTRDGRRWRASKCMQAAQLQIPRNRKWFCGWQGRTSVGPGSGIGAEWLLVNFTKNLKNQNFMKVYICPILVFRSTLCILWLLFPCTILKLWIQTIHYWFPKHSKWIAFLFHMLISPKPLPYRVLFRGWLQMATLHFAVNKLWKGGEEEIIATMPMMMAQPATPHRYSLGKFPVKPRNRTAIVFRQVDFANLWLHVQPAMDMCGGRIGGFDWMFDIYHAQ